MYKQEKNVKFKNLGSLFLDNKRRFIFFFVLMTKHLLKHDFGISPVSFEHVS